MFDFHLHCNLSFDSNEDPQNYLARAEELRLNEICFTDHYDYNSDPNCTPNLFSIEKYKKVLDQLHSSKVSVRRGIEFGLTRWNMFELDNILAKYPFDFVLGSVHFVDGYDPYEQQYWAGCNVDDAFNKYLLEIFHCVNQHSDYDVLGHLTYVCKSIHNPSHKPVPFNEYKDITDEIMRVLISKGKGMEVNTSGVDRAGDFLPSVEFLRRFKELGGEIVTVGSDAHDISRLGQYIPEAIEMLKDIFGYVCTFEKRIPIFHKL